MIQMLLLMMILIRTDLYKEFSGRHKRWLTSIFTDNRQSILIALFTIQHGRRQQLVLAFADAHQPEAVLCGTAVGVEGTVKATIASLIGVRDDHVGDERAFGLRLRYSRHVGTTGRL